MTNTKTTYKSTNHDIRHIPLDKCVPTGYQRPTSDKHVAEMVEDFDEVAASVLTVSLRGGNYHIMDGLHRSKVLKIKGYTHAQCIVKTGMTYEQEAEFYRRQNKNRRVISTFDDFKAGLEAKDEVCVKINDILKAYGFQVGKGDSFYKIPAIRALFNIVDDYGYVVLDETLCLLANTWSSIPGATRAECLLGVAEFVSRYGMALFSERLQEKYAVIFYDYTEAMRVRGSVGSTTSRNKFCRILVEHYNKGLTGNSKKRLKWEV